MKTFRFLSLAALVLLSFSRLASASGFIDRTVDATINEARHELHTGDLSLGSSGAASTAAISPRGDLLIDGTVVPLKPQQRKLLLDHRARILAIAEAGLEVGKEGGELAGHAIWGIPGLIFGGEKAAERFERRIEAKAARIELKALAICDRLPGLLESQQRLAVEVPEFAPWATLTQEDIEDCAADRAEVLARLDAER